jgi:hypothetical protein
MIPPRDNCLRVIQAQNFIQPLVDRDISVHLVHRFRLTQIEMESRLGHAGYVVSSHLKCSLLKHNRHVPKMLLAFFLS